MKGLPFVLAFTAMTFIAWGAYGPLLHHGTASMGRDSVRAFVGVGIAYFFIAVLVPIYILRTQGETGKWTISGTFYSLIAGAVGAIGALGVILALSYGGMPVYVMPLVFGFAPIVNTLVTAWMSKTFDQISPIFIGGIVVAALGVAGVLAFKPSAPAHAVHPTKASSPDASHDAVDEQKHSRIDRRGSLRFVTTKAMPETMQDDLPPVVVQPIAPADVSGKATTDANSKDKGDEQTVAPETSAVATQSLAQEQELPPVVVQPAPPSEVVKSVTPEAETSADAQVKTEAETPTLPPVVPQPAAPETLQPPASQEPAKLPADALPAVAVPSSASPSSATPDVVKPEPAKADETKAESPKPNASTPDTKQATAEPVLQDAKEAKSELPPDASPKLPLVELPKRELAEPTGSRIVDKGETTSDAKVEAPATKPAAPPANVPMIIVSIVVAAICWGSYGPMLHQGQARMNGSRLRPFTCVGLAYFVIAVAAPLGVIASRTTDAGAWSAGGLTWSIIAGAAGAIGALGVILAFNAGGKPYYVMPLVFGFAPVINTCISLTEAGTWGLVRPEFWISLAIVIAGAITVLINAPKPQHAKPHAPALKT